MDEELLSQSISPESSTPEPVAPVPAPTSAAVDGLAEAGLKALQRERERVKQLQAELNKFKGINLEEVAQQQKLLSEQYNTLQQQLQAEQAEKQRIAQEALAREQALQQQLVNRAIADQFRDTLADPEIRVLPGYEQMLLAAVGGELGITQDGQVVAGEGVELKEFTKGLRERFPAMFQPEAAPTGSGSRPSSVVSSQGAAPVVQRGDAKGFIANLDAIAKGQVKVS